MCGDRFLLFLYGVVVDCFHQCEQCITQIVSVTEINYWYVPKQTKWVGPIKSIEINSTTLLEITNIIKLFVNEHVRRVKPLLLRKIKPLWLNQGASFSKTNVPIKILNLFAKNKNKTKFIHIWIDQHLVEM